jgi:hypothetical protein
MRFSMYGASILSRLGPELVDRLPYGGRPLCSGHVLSVGPQRAVRRDVAIERLPGDPELLAQSLVRFFHDRADVLRGRA